jgi:tryptophan-rich sensory protein
MAGFYTVGAAYYMVMSVVTYRAALREESRSYRLAMVVLAGNELWNVALFGRRSPRGGFLGVLAFLVPLGLLQASVQHDRTSTVALGTYTAYVVAYDLPWSYRLWRLNPAADE